MAEFQGLINVFAGALIAILGWVARQIWEALRDLRKDLHKIEIALPRDYVRKDDLKEIKDLIQKIFDRLDQKADKS